MLGNFFAPTVTSLANLYQSASNLASAASKWASSTWSTVTSNAQTSYNNFGTLNPGKHTSVNADPIQWMMDSTPRMDVNLPSVNVSGISPNAIAGMVAAEQGSAPSMGPAPTVWENLSEAFSRGVNELPGMAWDTFKLWDNQTVAGIYDDSRASGSGVVGSAYNSVTYALGDLIGFNSIVDGVEGRTIDGSHLTPTQRAVSIGMGSAGVVATATGLAGAGKAAAGSAERVAANIVETDGRGLIGFIKPGGVIDDSLRESYLKIATSPEFVKSQASYNRLAATLGQKPSASVDDIVSVLKSDVTFARTGHLRSGLFTESHGATTSYWLQGNPTTAYGQRVGRHELMHLGAALNGQGDNFVHEVIVQMSTTPENLALGGAMLTGIVGAGYYLSQ